MGGTHGTGQTRHSPAWLTRLTAALAPLSRPSAFSWPVVAIYLPILIASQLTSDARALGGAFTAWSVSVIFSSLAFVIAFLLAGRIMRRWSEPSPFAVLTAYAVVGLVRALVAGFSLTYLGATEHPYLSYRLVGILYNTTLLAIIGYGVGRHDMHRAVVIALEEQRQRLSALERRLDEALERTRIELTTAVRVSIEPLLRALDTALTRATTGAGTTQALQALVQLIDERVRPLSQQLAEDDASDLDTDVPVSAPVSARVPLPARFLLADALRPILVAFLACVIGIPLAVRDLQFPQWIPYVLLLPAVTWATLAVARLMVGRFTAPTLIGAVLVVAVHAAIGLVFSALLNVLALPSPRAVQPMASILFGLIGVVSVASVLVEARQSATESDLAAVNARLEETITLVRRRNRLVRRRLARVMHGSMQGELYAAAMRLQSSPDPTALLAEEVRADVLGALRHLDSEAPVRGRTQRAVTAMTETWQGLREIRSTLGPNVALILDADPETDEAVAEVTTEAVNNALRHGDATTVEIHIDVQEAVDDLNRGRVLLVVRDNGSEWADDARQGQGTSLFDEFCRAWDHSTHDSWTTFRAEILLTEANASAVEPPLPS